MLLLKSNTQITKDVIREIFLRAADCPTRSTGTLKAKTIAESLSSHTQIPVRYLLDLLVVECDSKSDQFDRLFIDEEQLNWVADAFLKNSGQVLTPKVLSQIIEAELYLYGYIGLDILAKDFISELREKESLYKNVVIRINSPGGDIFEGLPIYNYIKGSSAQYTVQIDGLAASLASIVMCSGNHVRAASNSMVMIHGPLSGDFTHLEQLENIVSVMKKIRKQMAEIYGSKTGRSTNWVIENWLSDGKDHWFNAEEARQAKLVDEVYQVELQSPDQSLPARKMAAFYNQSLPRLLNKN